MFFQIPQMRPSTDICSKRYIIYLFDPLIAQPLQGMAPVAVKGNFYRRRRDNSDLSPTLQVFHKCLDVILKGSGIMRTCLNTGSTFDTFFIVNPNPEIPLVIHLRHIGIPHRASPHTGIAPYTPDFIHLNNTHADKFLL
jgi:hypothetical protein